MTQFSIQVDDAQLAAHLRRLAGRVADLSAPLADTARCLRNWTEDSFQGERSPFGPGWSPLTQAYVDRPRRTRTGKPGGRGGDAHPILQRDGGLAASVSGGHNRLSAWVGAGKRYAAIHQFGGKPGMAPGPAAIPARPFLPVSATGTIPAGLQAEILRLFEQVLQR